jgi:hypothetical protein
MQVDKESLIKYHFWILLGIYMPLALIGLLLLWTSVSGAVDEKAAKLKKTKDDLKAANKPDHKNEKWTAVLKDKEGVLNDQKNTMWKQVWDAQASIMTWPPALVKDFPELEKLYFLDKLNRNLRDRFVHDASGYYSQLMDQNYGIPYIVDPVDNKGFGTVQYKDGWQSVIHFVSKVNGGWPDVKQTGSDIPDSDDCWLAQEDLWVQRELLLVVREANNISAFYKKQPNPPAPDKSKGELDRQVFTNSRWKLDLILEPRNLRWQLTNLSTRRQQVAMTFLVRRKGLSQNDEVWVDGEPLAPQQASKWGVKPFPSGLTGLASIESVQEVLDWRSATVKRIDKLDLYHHSHRTFAKGLNPPPTKEDPTAAAAAPPPMPAAGPGDGGMAEAGRGMGMMAAPPEIVTHRRYIDVNDQVRRMAVGMVLIVDQSRIQDVLTALANSRLRVQITQVHWQHYQGSIKPPVLDDKSTAGGKNFNWSDVADRPRPGFSRFAGFEAGARPGMREAGAFIGRGGLPGAPGTENSFDADAVAASDESANTVELAVYGIASLYQKFPPKPPDAPGGDPAAAGAAAAPGTPAPAPK